MRASSLPVFAASVLIAASCAQVAGLGDRERLADDAAVPDAGEDAPEAEANPDTASEPPVEVCNFLSENYDGLTDHGFDWSVGPWQTDVSVAQAVALKAVALPDGRVAVAALDQNSSRVQVFVVDATGALISGPAEIKSPASVSGFGLAVAGTDAGEIGVAAGSSDPGCLPNCVWLTRYDSTIFAETETRALDPSMQGQSYKLRDLYDLNWSTAGYIVLGVDEEGSPRLIMADHMSDSFGSKQWPGAFSVAGPDVGVLAVGPEIAWAMAGSAGGMSKAALGITSIGGYSELLTPQSPDLPSQKPQFMRDAKALAWLGDDIVYTRTVSSGSQAFGWLSRFDGSGQMVSQALANLGTGSHSVVVVDRSPVVTYFEGEGIGIARFDPHLVRIDTPSGDIQIAGTMLLAIAAYPRGITLVRVSPDGAHVEAAPLKCP